MERGKKSERFWVGVGKRVLIAIGLFGIVYCVENGLNGFPFIISCAIIYSASDIKD